MSAEALDRLRKAYESSGILGCKLCPLHTSRSRVVLGDGGYALPLVFLGEAPGKSEDNVGKPFVGKAGALLERVLASLGYSRTHVVILNAVKCRPPRNRRPGKEELEACSRYLRLELEALRPRVIVTLGVTGLQALTLIGRVTLERIGAAFDYPSVRVSKLRGSRLKLETGVLRCTIIPTYHPAACLRNPGLRGLLEKDLAEAFSLLREAW